MPTKEEYEARLVKWLAALRDPATKQARFKLRAEDGGMCCLGVACNVISPDWVAEEGGFSWADTHASVLLPLSVQEYYGLHDEGGSTEHYGSLTFMNDSGLTFERIANFIEARKSALFTWA